MALAWIPVPEGTTPREAVDKCYKALLATFSEETRAKAEKTEFYDDRLPRHERGLRGSDSLYLMWVVASHNQPEGVAVHYRGQTSKAIERLTAHAFN